MEMITNTIQTNGTKIQVVKTPIDQCSFCNDETLMKTLQCFSNVAYSGRN